MKKWIKAAVYPLSSSDECPPPNLMDFESWLRSMRFAIPEKHRNTAQITFSCIPEIWYERPETEEEMNERFHEGLGARR